MPPPTHTQWGRQNASSATSQTMNELDKSNESQQSSNAMAFWNCLNYNLYFKDLFGYDVEFYITFNILGKYNVRDETLPFRNTKWYQNVI